MEKYCKTDKINYWGNNFTPKEMNLVKERVLSIFINDKLTYRVTHTPFNQKEFAIGFSVTSGLLKSKEDIKDIVYYNENDSDIVKMTIYNAEKKDINRVDDIEYEIDYKKIDKIINSLSEYQPLYEKTRATHAAVIFDKNYSMIATAEDIGRHNTVDKSVGDLYIKNLFENASILLVSSRISYDLILKVVNANIPILLALSRPSKLAIETAKEFNIKIITIGVDNGLDIFT